MNSEEAIETAKCMKESLDTGKIVEPKKQSVLMENMELKDIVLKKGDIVTLDDGEKRCFYTDNNFGFFADDVYDKKRIVKIERVKEYETIYEAPKEILNKEEKEWLENFLRPFKDKVKSICKFNIWVAGRYNELIEVIYQSIRDSEERLDLPEYKAGTMYKDMEQDKKYTLEELGLFKE